MSQKPNSLNKPILLLAAAIVIVTVVVVVWGRREAEDTHVQRPLLDPYASIDFEDPKASFALLQFVANEGGDEILQDLAIDWLSEQYRGRTQLQPRQEEWLFSMLEDGGHSDWEIGYKLWLFNDAFNVLHNARDQERLTALLKGLALTHEAKDMRLYALQHIELQRSVGHLTGPLAEEIRGTLKTLAYDPQSEVAGTALVNLTLWEGKETPPSQDLINLALELAADTQRTDDIRVTALHSVHEHSLELSRKLATDLKQSVHVRKAAIAWMGKYGSEADADTLRELAQENFRIAQAAKPALEAINSRKNGKPARTLIEL